MLPNSPPETEITATPPSLERTDFRVHFYWNGEDLDGEIAGFEWRISDNGDDGVIDIPDTLESALPWRFTTSLDSIFEVVADLDSFYADVEDPDVNPNNYRSWQTHTFFVRAVDDAGARDPTPAQSSFTTTTLTPSVRVTIPQLKTNSSCTSSAQVLTFGWKALDPDGQKTAPAETRYIIKTHPGTVCLTAGSYQLSQPIRAADPDWSPWAPYDPDDPETHTVTFPRAEVGNMYLFAVQARDVAGAVTPTFTWNENVRHVRISGSKFPQLTMTDPILGNYSYVGTNGVRGFEIIGGLPIRTTWLGDASDYAGIIDAYRWGWDVDNPDDPADPNWAVQWGNSSGHRNAGVATFEEGIHRLTVACRDNSGTVTRATWVVTIIPVPEREFQRQLLIIEDLPIGGEPVSEALERRFREQLINLADGKLRYFVPGDFIDADISPERITFKELVRYQAVVWVASGSTQTFYQDTFNESGGIFGGGSGLNGVHWLEVYQQRAGNLMYVGTSAAEGTIPGFGARSLPVRYDNANLWIFRAFCVELSDQVRPPLGNILGEDSNRPLRSLDCDLAAEAYLADEYIERFPESPSHLSTLRPAPEREALNVFWSFPTDEFYNYNGTQRNVRIVNRDCQLPFLRMKSRRAAGTSTTPASDCPPNNSQESLLEGAPIAMASDVNADTKPLRGSEDYLLGFNPMSFRQDDVQRLFLYIFERRWELETF